jgi:putative nucleotidyltransferase with HDIG domain
MLVHVVADTSAKLAGVRTVLERKHAVTSELLGGLSPQRSSVRALVVKADLRTVESICTLKKLFGSLGNVRKRIFLIDDTVHLSVSQAYALGATSVLVGPLNQTKLLAELSEHTTPGASADPVDPLDAEATASAGEIALASMFSAIASGTRIDVTTTKDAGFRIAACIEEYGLSKWLATVRSHHEGTYQHCLLVTGVAIDFGLSLGVPKSDIERLYTAAMFHDIGKAMIPLTVLDKPGRLDEQERKLIETHPAAGYDALKDNKGISAEVLDAVRHHHEYLDGSGYPDALCAESIPDIVRILTVSDIFGALIEKRSYKQSMTRQAAYDILCGMNGKLEKPLVAAFKEVALTR